jgi:hypothetical protein
MKKLALATAVAAAISSGAFAGNSSNITGISMVVGGIDIVSNCASAPFPGFSSGLTLGGIGTGNDEIVFVGDVCLDPGGGAPIIAISFNLLGEAVTGGTEFNNGHIHIYAAATSGWVSYAIVPVTALNPIDCTTAGGKAGLQWASPNTLPGVFGVGAPVCATTLFSNPADLHLSGTNSN